MSSSAIAQKGTPDSFKKKKKKAIVLCRSLRLLKSSFCVMTMIMTMMKAEMKIIRINDRRADNNDDEID